MIDMNDPNMKKALGLTEEAVEAQVTLTGYLDKVSEYWGQCGPACARCMMNDPDRGCDLLYAPVIPEGDCLGLLERDGVKQPA